MKAARALLRWSQDDLAEAARVSVPTIKRLEASDGPLGGRQDTGQKLIAALEEAGIEFIEGSRGEVGVRIRSH